MNQKQKTAADERSTNTLGDTKYANSAKALNDVIDALRTCGTAAELDLPCIVVIGKQSSGKSSLLESISKVKLPKYFETCTRCPMEFKLRTCKDGNNWSCKISLRFTKDVQDKKKGDHEFTIIDKSRQGEVEIALRRAQLALLSPSKEIDSFLEMTKEQIEEAAAGLPDPFTDNSVVIEIDGAEVDVTLIDLPGLIADVQASNKITNESGQEKSECG